MGTEPDAHFVPMQSPEGDDTPNCRTLPTEQTIQDRPDAAYGQDTGGDPARDKD
jgi:hypothetical protein